MRTRLHLERAQILAFRRRVGVLEERVAPGEASLRQAAWAGLQDSMPRAALLSIHARVQRTEPSTWEDPSLVQLWGPRFSAYVVAKRDLAVFSLGRLPEDARERRRAEEIAARLDTFLGGARMPYGQAGRGLGEPPNRLRYAAPTGRVLIRWDGARQPTIWTVPPPDTDPRDARLELARRYLHIFGPTTSTAFAAWAGIRPALARAAFEGLGGSMVPVRTPVGEAWILAADEPAFREPPATASSGIAARLLPSGDAYFLLQGSDRELLVPEAGHRRDLWTTRVWPGAILVAGEVIGTWRRANELVTLQPWHRLSSAERDAVVAEAESLPVPGIRGRVVAAWAG
jgi:hypothetical protein